MITQCCVCKRYRADDGSWVAMRVPPSDVRVSHTYCDECIAEEEEKVTEWTKGLKGRVPA